MWAKHAVSGLRLTSSLVPPLKASATRGKVGVEFCREDGKGGEGIRGISLHSKLFPWLPVFPVYFHNDHIFEMCSRLF